jgi:hypothetical protein
MAWQTTPSTIISTARQYKLSDLAALFGISTQRLRILLLEPVYEVLGSKVLNWIAAMGGSGSFDYIPQSGMTGQTVAAFQALYPYP